jgi:hypothetical protein
MTLGWNESDYRPVVSALPAVVFPKLSIDLIEFLFNGFDAIAQLSVQILSFFKLDLKQVSELLEATPGFQFLEIDDVQEFAMRHIPLPRALSKPPASI